MSRCWASSGGSASSRARISRPVRAAQGATAQIPILAATDDMVGQGFVHSLAKPNGNTTGVTILASELDGKRQEILMEAVPGEHRIAALYKADMPTCLRFVRFEG
jgi:putative ABC transport system substrate-binding protein